MEEGPIASPMVMSTWEILWAIFEKEWVDILPNSQAIKEYSTIREDTGKTNAMGKALWSILKDRCWKESGNRDCYYAQPDWFD